MNDITVIKFGTGTLAGVEVATMKNGDISQYYGTHLDRNVFRSAAKQIVELRRRGRKPVIVTSGAILAGAESLGPDEARKYSDTQLASIGQYKLMEFWANAFLGKANFDQYERDDFEKVPIGQILITYKNLADADERKKIIGNILGLVENGAIPIINENDPVSAEEVVLFRANFGDNDTLTSMLAPLIGAKSVLFLTDLPYVYESEPKRYSIEGGVSVQPKPPRHYIKIDCNNIPDHLRNVPVGPHSRGGITSKVSGAAMCAKLDMKVIITKFNHATDLALEYDPSGTLIRFEESTAKTHIGTLMCNQTVLEQGGPIIL